jgi:MinD superfamily P-loop ATPase
LTAIKENTKFYLMRMRNILKHKKLLSARPEKYQRRLLLNLIQTTDGHIIAKELAEEIHFNHTLTNGPPALACHVIGSIAGAAEVVIVAELTLSGHHDMDRVVESANHFDILDSMCINKCDLNADMTVAVE